MKRFLFLFTLVLVFTGLSQVEGKSNYQFVNFMKFLKLMKANYQFVNFMEFLKLMKANGWDKKFFDSNNRKIVKNLLLPKKINGSELELESLESKKKEKTLRNFHEGKN